MSLAGDQQLLLDSLRDAPPEAFTSILSRHQARADDLHFEDLLQAWPLRLKQDLHAAIESKATNTLQQLQGHEEDPKDCSETAADELDFTKEAAAQNLQGIVQLMQLFLKDQPAALPGHLQRTACLLHDHALLAATEVPELQEAVAKLCMAYWLAGAPSRERMVAQLLPYLLVCALTSGKPADVKRCFTMRDALTLLDFDDESIGDLKRLLLRAAFSPAFLRASEGRRYLAFLFTLQPQFVRELTAIVRNQIPSGRKSILRAYGEIMYRAWRQCVGPCLYEVEHTLIQGLMQAAILASTPAMASSLQCVLGGLHEQKTKDAEVDALLTRLYGPILFRSLSAANACVRRNSLMLLLEAFPLQDPEGKPEESEALLARQFKLLDACLVDEAPAVRAAAVKGVCSLLNIWWEIVPQATLIGFLRRISGELAFDAADSGVRAAVPAGMAELVVNPLAHPLLKLMLPQLKSLLHDSAVRVRSAMATLLEVIAHIKGLHFTDIVSLEVLLEVMAHDSAAVAQPIQRLLVPSCFPDGPAGPSLVITLLCKSPEPALAFCQALIAPWQAFEQGRASGGSPLPAERVLELLLAIQSRLMGACNASTPASTLGAGAAAKKQRIRRSKEAPAAAANDADVASSASADSSQKAESAPLTAAEWATLTDALAMLSSGLAAAQTASLLEPSALATGWGPGQMTKLLKDLNPSGTLGDHPQDERHAEDRRKRAESGRRADELMGVPCDNAVQDSLIQAGTALSSLVAGGEARAWCLKQLKDARFSQGRIDVRRLQLWMRCIATDQQHWAVLWSHITTAMNGSTEQAAGMSKQTALQCVDACLACEQLRLQAAATGMLSQCLSALLPSSGPTAVPPNNRSGSSNHPHPQPIPSQQQTNCRGRASRAHLRSGNQLGPEPTGLAPVGDHQADAFACNGQSAQSKDFTAFAVGLRDQQQGSTGLHGDVIDTRGEAIQAADLLQQQSEVTNNSWAEAAGPGALDTPPSTLQGAAGTRHGVQAGHGPGRRGRADKPGHQQKADSKQAASAIGACQALTDGLLAAAAVADTLQSLTGDPLRKALESEPAELEPEPKRSRSVPAPPPQQQLHTSIRSAAHAVATCLALASDAVACLPQEACQGSSRIAADSSSASQTARQDALQGIVHASALLAASAADLVYELCSGADDSTDKGSELGQLGQAIAGNAAKVVTQVRTFCTPANDARRALEPQLHQAFSETDTEQQAPPELADARAAAEEAANLLVTAVAPSSTWAAAVQKHLPGLSAPLRSISQDPTGHMSRQQNLSSSLARSEGLQQQDGHGNENIQPQEMQPGSHVGSQDKQKSRLAHVA
ncbi:hypothetical protein WJX74_000685 [Apatococcus lobatus]|uniref:Uncharacterized protein n=1 Tax=Apatococcus lobatus TaxID=904363 RepID=A0AAW1QXD5_9CHLO